MTTIVSAHTARLTGSGFTVAQAEAIDTSVQMAAEEAVSTLEGTLARWHAYLALYLLIQIGIVVLTILMMQVIKEPTALPVAMSVGHLMQDRLGSFPAMSNVRLERPSLGELGTGPCPTFHAPAMNLRESFPDDCASVRANHGSVDSPLQKKFLEPLEQDSTLSVGLPIC